MGPAHASAALVALVLFLATPATGFAHDPGLSAMTVEARDGGLAVHVVVARRELEPLAAIDTDGDGTVSGSELAVAQPRLQALGATAVRVETPGGTAAADGVSADVDDSDAVHLRVTFAAPASAQATVHVPLIARLALGHRQYVQVHDVEGELVAEHVLHANAPVFAVSPSAPRVAGLLREFRAFVLLGLEHIATGYDHVLFLVALLVVGPSLRTATAIITSFTVAHSVTLALATLGVVRLAPAIVEPVIAASVLYVGMENLRARPLAPRWIATFAFGLVHGLGFSTALTDLGVGVAGAPSTLPLVGFNLGVEMGQLAVAAIVLPVIWHAQRRPRLGAHVATACSVLVVVVGAAWLLQRTLLD